MWWFFLAACSAPEPSVVDGAPDTFRIGSWNLEWLASAPGRGMRPRTAEEYEAIGRVIAEASADVWVLQEVEDDRAVARVLPRGWSVHVEPRRDDQRVAVAVRPGVAARFSDVPAIAVGQPGLRQGVQVDVDGLAILGVHLKAGCQWDPLDRGEACATLARQVAALEAWIDGQEGPFVVVGDLNRQIAPDDEVWAALDDGDPAGLSLIAPLSGRADACPGSRHRHPIDHALVGGTAAERVARAEQIPVAGLSDHCPVVVDLTRGW